MEQRPAHPLDIDLLGVALGDTDATLAAEVAEHLGTCLLCRVRMTRLRRGGAVPLGDPATSTPVTSLPTPLGVDRPSVSTAVLAVLDDGARPDAVAAGQVWLAGDRHRLLVWVRTVRAERV